MMKKIDTLPPPRIPGVSGILMVKYTIISKRMSNKILREWNKSKGVLIYKDNERTDP
jgi:hypothetical protein